MGASDPEESKTAWGLLTCKCKFNYSDILFHSMASVKESLPKLWLQLFPRDFLNKLFP